MFALVIIAALIIPEEPSNVVEEAKDRQEPWEH